MYCKAKFCLVIAMSIFLGGCVSKVEFDTLNEEYLLASKQLTSVNDKVRMLEEELKELQAEKEKLEAENVRLGGELDKLEKSVKEKDLVISVQGKVIKFLDDPNQTLQKSIEKQIADQK